MSMQGVKAFSKLNPFPPETLVANIPKGEEVGGKSGRRGKKFRKEKRKRENRRFLGEQEREEVKRK